MAEGGDTFGYDIPIIGHNDDDDEEQEINTTQPFQPGAASTPHPVGEQIQMQTMEHEQSGLPDTSYDETPLLGDDETPLLSDFISPEEKRNHLDKAFDYIKSKFPRVDFEKLGPIGFGKKTSTHTNIVSYGPKGGEAPIFKKDGSGFLKSFTEKYKKTLGPSAEEIIAKKSAEIQDDKKEIAVAEKHQKQLDDEIEKKMREMKQNKSKSLYSQRQIDDLKDQHGDNASDSELQKWKRDKRKYSQEAEKNEKNIKDLEKKAKENEEMISRKKARVNDKEKEKKQTEEQLYKTKSLDELKEREVELRRQNNEDQAIIDSAEKSPSERQAAEGRVEERNDELERIQPQIAEREEAMPLRERIKEIFKKHGVTVTAIVIAAGVTIGAVVSSITKGLKATGKAMAGGLKEIGAKLGSLLPGLIGQVAHFLFNTAAKAVGFLAEHTWLIILAVVAFLFEKYIKKRR